MNKLNKISNRPAIAILQAYIYSFLSLVAHQNLRCIYGASAFSVSQDSSFMPIYMRYTLLIILTLREHITEFTMEHILTSAHCTGISH